MWGLSFWDILGGCGDLVDLFGSEFAMIQGRTWRGAYKTKRLS
jgi:hypothetical protein